ncbi:hypothetical protein [Microbulbifer halophilus]|uniref:ABC transmembrane type-1 domain-containing protein n=1 Tax=Microbulbifer halophilus TaxID=453963 RepID=A0ABW5EFS1_9GAMM|nr:hypothetical protein [Microbulbifer halophilus]MCW8127952.1 hypothetical protein [Microbulbifer halophilus]
MTVVSQISMLLASFLPLKVAILLGSKSLPVYFPEELSSFGRDTLIVGLSGVAVGFFLIHILSQRLTSMITQKASGDLLRKNQKMVLFENQDEVAAITYQRFSRALSDGVFSSVALLALILLYPDMSVALLGYLGFISIVLFSISFFIESFQEVVRKSLDKTVKLFAGFGFFTVFSFLVADFIVFRPPSVVVAIVSLLLARQLLNRLSSLVQDIASLYKQRARINALFFHGKVLIKGGAAAEKGIWPLLMPDSRSDWGAELLSRVVPGWEGAKRFEWHFSSNGNAGVLKAVSLSGEKDYLLKLFDGGRKSVAIHESTLLSEAPEAMPAPRFLGAVDVSDFICLVYQIPKAVTLPSGRDLQLQLNRLRGSLLALEPSVALVQRYRRSKPLLWQRLEPNLLKRLLVAVDTVEQERQVARLIDHLPAMKQYLKSLPLVVTNSEFGEGSILVDQKKNEPLMLNWGRWSLEPVGSGWPVRTGAWRSKDQLYKLSDALQVAAGTRSSLAGVRVELAELAALLAALEERCLRQQFINGLEIVDRIMKLIDSFAEQQSIVSIS